MTVLELSVCSVLNLLMVLLLFYFLHGYRWQSQLMACTRLFLFSRARRQTRARRSRLYLVRLCRQECERWSRHALYVLCVCVCAPRVPRHVGSSAGDYLHATCEAPSPD